MSVCAPIPIIILNWNGLADTRECIAALKQQTFQNFEIFLVDNGSAPEEVEAICLAFQQDAQIHLQFNGENLGFTRGNNRMLSQILNSAAPPPYFVLLNNDTHADPNWLAELIETAKTKKADMVASKMINYYDRDRMDNAGHHLLNTLEILPIGHDEPVKNYQQAFENMGPCAGAALYTSTMLKEIGIFDDHFRNGYEDVEIGLRGIMCGYTSIFAPRAVVYHKVSRSVNRIRDFEYTVNIQRHIYYIIAKLIPSGALLVCLPFLIFRTLSGLLINILFFRWKFLKVQLSALKCLIRKDWKVLRQSRKKFFAGHSTISSRQLLQKMDFFLKKDLQRFYKYLIRKEKMVFERYD